MARPESPRFAAETLEAPKLELLVERKIAPEASIVYGAWGRPVGNDELLDTYIESAGLTDKREIAQADTLIKGTGITTRHISQWGGTIFEVRDEVARQMIDVGTELTRRALEMNGKKGSDVGAFFVTSSIPPDEYRLKDEKNWARIMARRLGIREAKMKLYYLACGGAGAAFLEALNTPELKNETVVITSAEALSAGIRWPPQTVENLTASAIFGNGGGSFVFEPSQFERYSGITKIVPDEKGVICCPKLYSLPPKSLHREPPYWVNADGVSDEIFAWTDDEVSMMLPPPKGDPNYIEMYGMATAKFFIGNLPEVEVEVIEESRVDVWKAILHQASGQVNEGVVRAINRRLEKLGKPKVSAPWILSEVGMGNVSSATTLIAMAELMDRKDGPVNIASFGVGAAITAMVVRVKS